MHEKERVILDWLYLVAYIQLKYKIYCWMAAVKNIASLQKFNRKIGD